MPDFTQLKQRQAAAWSNGRFEECAIALADMHTVVVETGAPRPGQRWLDIGCGAGHVAELAAGGGATVTGVDLSPRLIEVAKERAAAGGFDIDYRVGDAERLVGLDDAAFDVVSSSVGVIFAPDHEAAAHEIARVTRPGGRLVMTAWTPEGSIGTFFRIAGAFQPPPPPGAGSPVQWGEEGHVRAYLGDAFDLSIDRRISHYEEPSLEVAWEMVTTRFGPVKTALENLPPDKAEEFARVMREHLESTVQADGSLVDDREYLLITGTRR